jgi:YHS domain-containing protein
MAQIDSLLSRLDAEFASNEQAIKNLQSQALQSYEGRQERLKLFEQDCIQLRNVWKPRLEALATKFGDHVKVTPQLTPELRKVDFNFESKLAVVKLQFSATTDSDVRKLIVTYDLEILPILMEYQRHAQIEFPLDAVDPAALGRWLDDRIIDFVKAYLAMSHNQYYLKDHMVVDPVAGVTFPKFAAAATLERNGKTVYFVAEKTKNEYEKQEGAGAASKK